ncbi:hypothetical protein EV361DRAFT_943668, partial [Lentinula raphanica]
STYLYSLCTTFPSRMVSLLHLRELRLRPHRRDGRTMHSFLYFHPEASSPFVQRYAFGDYPNQATRPFEIIMDLMTSEYVAPNASIHSLHQVNDDSSPFPGARFVLLFLDNPDPPDLSFFPDPIEPISEFHVMVFGVYPNGNVRSVNAENIQPLLDFFAFITR